MTRDVCVIVDEEGVREGGRSDGDCADGAGGEDECVQHGQVAVVAARAGDVVEHDHSSEVPKGVHAGVLARSQVDVELYNVGDEGCFGQCAIGREDVRERCAGVGGGAMHAYSSGNTKSAHDPNNQTRNHEVSASIRYRSRHTSVFGVGYD